MISITLFEKSEIPYFVTGSIASIFYGEPRLTHDIDIVVHLSKSDFAKVTQLFPLEDYYCPPEDVIIRKLEFYQQGGSDKHLSDIKKMFPQVDADLDQTFLQNQFTLRNLMGLWKECR